MLEEVKTKAYEESETSLDDTEALDALLSSFRNAKVEEQKTEGHRAYGSLLSKRLFVGTFLRPGGVDRK